MDVFENSDQIRLAALRKTSGDSNLIPLINIVFLLLIFFMVAGHIQAQDGNDIQPPQAESAVSSTAAVVDIQINRQNEIFLDGQGVSAEELQATLTTMRQEEPDQMLIKADRDVIARDLGALLELLRSSGVRNIRLLTQDSGN